ncbi:MAG TPA: ribosome silencing factor [Alloacidobacterium sp.]|nr:ribosome silencing factor [Alloacidobacterium sp.]
MASTETRKMVLAAAAACEDKKGEDTRVLELDPADSGFTDFFLITSAANDRQAVAIGDEIELRLKREFGAYPNSVEGRKQGEWILIDYVDFVVHIFVGEKRAFYDLERLWKSARTVDMAELKAALAEKVTAMRKKESTKKSAAKKTMTKKAVKAAPAKKAAAKKTAGKTTSKTGTKKSTARKKSS